MTILDDILIVHRLYGHSPGAQVYLRDCKIAFEQLEKFNEGVEAGLCANSWINSD